MLCISHLSVFRQPSKAKKQKLTWLYKTQVLKPYEHPKLLIVEASKLLDISQVKRVYWTNIKYHT